MVLSPPLKPAQHARHQILTAVLGGKYPPGSTLPSERELSEKLGVTRPTLREVLQRLSSEGWIAIRHGKPTVVNNYWEEGGLGLLGTMIQYAEFLPDTFVENLLQLRVHLVPSVATLAAVNAPDVLVKHLGLAGELKDSAKDYTAFDWSLQLLIAKHSGNPIYPLVFNDFGSVFKIMGVGYFELPKARQASLRFYRKLGEAIENRDNNVEEIVKQAMQESIAILREVRIVREDSE